MGCNNTKTQHLYSITEDIKNSTENQKENLWIHPEMTGINDYIEKLASHTVIDDILRNLDKNPNQTALGFRKPIDATTCEKTFTYTKYSEIKTMAINLSKNLMIQGLCSAQFFEDEGNN